MKRCLNRALAALLSACLIAEPAAAALNGGRWLQGALGRTDPFARQVRGHYDSQALKMPLVFPLHPLRESFFAVRQDTAELAKQAFVPEAYAMAILSLILVASFFSFWSKRKPAVPTPPEAERQAALLKIAELLVQVPALLNPQKPIPANLAKAREMMQQVLELAPLNPQKQLEIELTALKNISVAFMLEGDAHLDGAKKIISEALEQAKNAEIPIALRLDLWFRLGEIHFLSKEDDEAKPLLRLCRDAAATLLGPNPDWPRHDPAYLRIFELWGDRIGEKEQTALEEGNGQAYNKLRDEILEHRKLAVFYLNNHYDKLAKLSRYQAQEAKREERRKRNKVKKEKKKAKAMKAASDAQPDTVQDEPDAPTPELSPDVAIQRVREAEQEKQRLAEARLAEEKRLQAEAAEAQAARDAELAEAKRLDEARIAQEKADAERNRREAARLAEEQGAQQVAAQIADEKRQAEETAARDRAWQYRFGIGSIESRDSQALLEWLAKKDWVDKAAKTWSDELDKDKTPFDVIKNQVLPVILPNTAADPRLARDLALGRKSLADYLAQKEKERQAVQAEQEKIRRAIDEPRRKREAAARLAKEEKRKKAEAEAEVARLEAIRLEVERERTQSAIRAAEERRRAEDEERARIEAEQIATKERTRIAAESETEEMRKEAEAEAARLAAEEERRQAEENARLAKAAQEEAEFAAELEQDQQHRDHVRTRLLQRFKGVPNLNPAVQAILDQIVREAMSWESKQLESVGQGFFNSAYIVAYWLRPRLPEVRINTRMAKTIAESDRPFDVVELIIATMQKYSATIDEARTISDWVQSDMTDDELQYKILEWEEQRKQADEDGFVPLVPAFWLTPFALALAIIALPNRESSITWLPAAAFGIVGLFMIRPRWERLHRLHRLILHSA